MNNLSNRHQASFNSESEGGHSLWQYIQSLSPETVAQLSKPSSNELFQVMERTIAGMLGSLPSGQFNLSVTTSREHLSRLLAAATINGYFLHNVEQRMALEKSLQIPGNKE